MGLVGLVAGLTVGLAPPAGATSAVFTVTSTADTHDPGTLRTTIDLVNGLAADAVTIDLPAGTYALSSCVALPDDTNVAGDLDLHPATPTAPISFVGTGGQATIEQNCGSERIIDQFGTGRLSLTDVSINDGNGTTSGGGVRAAGSVSVTNGSFTHNHAHGLHGQDQPQDAYNCEVLAPSVGGPADGGAISAAGAVDLTNTNFNGNTAQAAAGSAVNEWCGGGGGGAASGGAVRAGGDVTISGGTFASNLATAGAGGWVYVYFFDQPGGDAAGGAVWAGGNLVVTGATLTGNNVTGGAYGGRATGGALRADGNTTLTNASITSNHVTGATGQSAGCGLRPGGVGEGGGVWSGGTLTATGVTLSLNVATGGAGVGYGLACAPDPGLGGAAAGGGALAHGDLTLHTSTVSTNRIAAGAAGMVTSGANCCLIAAGATADGGGVRALAALAIDHSTFTSNLATGGVGGPGGASHGGGAASVGPTSVVDSELASNQARAGAGKVQDPFDELGGASAGGGLWSDAAITLSRSTIRANRADGGPAGPDNEGTGHGGGVAGAAAIGATNTSLVTNLSNDAAGGAAAWGATLDLLHVTVNTNSGTSAVAATTITTSRSVFAGQVGGAICSAPTVISHGYNRSADASCTLGAAGDGQNAASPLLGPPAANGGPTATELPGPGSPLIDAIPTTACPTVFDQRGVGRPGGTGCDIGAVEVDGPPAPTFADVPPSSPFHDDIAWLVLHGLASGYGDNTFHPTDPVTRQAMAAFLYRFAGSPDGAHPTCATAPFPDVAATAPFCGEISWLVAHGIATGYGDGTFRPTAPVTRQATAAYLFRLVAALAATPGPDPTCSTAPFSDVPTDSPFCGVIAWVVDHHITTGYNDGTFRPSSPVTRQAMAAFLHRL